MSRFILDSLPDLDETMGEYVKVSLEGAGGLGIEHWVGEEAHDRPFHSVDHFSYRALLRFAHGTVRGAPIEGRAVERDCCIKEFLNT
jgi:hypothetical protein